MRSVFPVLTLALSLFQPLPAMAFELPWISSAEAAPEGPPRPVVTEILTDRDRQGRSVPGVIMANNQVTMAFQTLGRLIVRNVELGDEVATADILAELDPDDLADNVRAARAALDAAEVQLSTTRATAERTRSLARRNVASTAQLERAQQALASAEASVEQARSELIRAQDAEGFAQMAAPFDGVISAVYANPGAILTAGEPVVQLSADDDREAAIDLPEAALSGLDLSAVFAVWQDGNPDLQTRATIDRIEPLTDVATRTRRVHLTLEDASHLRLGSLVRAQLASEDQLTLSLPEQAVLRQGDQASVWRVTRSGGEATVTLVPIDPGAALLGRVIVKSGLQPGDEIVVRGVHSLSEGQQVGRRLEP